MTQPDFSTYQSPFSWRYGSDEMRQVFSEQNKYQTWRAVWVALAEAQHKAGLVSDEELADLKTHQSEIDIDRILEIEVETKHDVVAAIREYAEKTPLGGGKIHLGATSMDVVDNTDALRVQNAIKLTEPKVIKLLGLFADQIEKYADLPTMGFTHLQTAEPTTVGYRLAFYAQDLLTDLEFLRFAKGAAKAKGMKGAVGTAASYQALLDGNDLSPAELEKDVMERLGLDATLISTQVYSRKYDYIILSVLNSLASTMAKFAIDLRLLQSPVFGEWSEPFGKNQVGSSAMPFKRNPMASEKICSLARYVSGLPNIALENASLSMLERTLDDSANRRIIIAEAFLAIDEILNTAVKVVSGLVINQSQIKRTLDKYAPFAATEAIMMAAVKQGADRQVMHELLRDLSLQAWAMVQDGQANPIAKLLGESEVTKYLKPDQITALLDVSHHIGDAPQRARQLVEQIRKVA